MALRGDAVVAVGFGIPCADRPTGAGSRRPPCTCRSQDVPFARRHARAARAPGRRSTTTPTPRCSPSGARGAAHGATDAVLLTIGTGIGGGMVVAGRLDRGTIGAGPELGHMVIDVNGPPCPGGCPNRGCLEAFASGQRDRRGPRGRWRVEAARQRARPGAGRRARDHRPARHRAGARRRPGRRATLIERCGRHLGVGIATLVNIFNPEVVVVGGGVIAAGDLLLEPARAVVARARALARRGTSCEIVPARFGAGGGDARAPRRWPSRRRGCARRPRSTPAA